MIPIDFGNLYEAERKRKEKEKIIGGYDINEGLIGDFADPNYKPKSILDQFADPEYVPESIQDKIAKEVPMDQQLSISELMLNAKAKDSKQLRESKALSKYAADLNKFDKAAKAKAEKEKFVPKDTLLGRIFDKRIKPGEDISNSAKASAMLRNVSDNLLERRLVGGKEGTDTLSRILGPSGGIREGMTEIEALETAAQSKNLATILADQKLRRGEADIKKVAADTALQKAGINTENMDSDTKFAYYQTLAELGEDNIGYPIFQKKLLENMKRQQSVEILDNIGPEYTKALDVLRVEKPGTPEYDRALKMLQLYGSYLPGLEDMAKTTEVQSAKELTNS